MKININKKHVHLTDVLINYKNHIFIIDIYYNVIFQRDKIVETHPYILSVNQQKKVAKANLTLLLLDPIANKSYLENDSNRVLEVILGHDQSTCCSFFPRYTQLYFRIKPMIYIANMPFKWLYINSIDL